MNRREFIMLGMALVLQPLIAEAQQMLAGSTMHIVQLRAQPST
jgi:hypothetical protein